MSQTDNHIAYALYLRSDSIQPQQLLDRLMSSCGRVESYTTETRMRSWVECYGSGATIAHFVTIEGEGVTADELISLAIQLAEDKVECLVVEQVQTERWYEDYENVFGYKQPAWTKPLYWNHDAMVQP